MGEFLRADCDIGVLVYAQELFSGTATLLEDVPAVGVVCKALLGFEALVERAKRNKDELVVLRELCEVVFKGLILGRRLDSSGRTGVHDGLDALASQVERAKAVANLCRPEGMNKISQLVLSRKVYKEIAAVRKDLLDFSAAVNVVITNELHAKLDHMAQTLSHQDVQLEVMQRNLEPERKFDVGHQVGPLNNEGDSGAKDGETRERCKAGKAQLPPEAPRLREWYVERKAAVAQVCDWLGIESGRGGGDATRRPRVVGLAGPGGAGKSTLASMVVAREDVRASFQDGILWLSVGKGAKSRLPFLMFDLATSVWKTVLRKTGRRPRTANVGINLEDGAAYIRDVVRESKRRFLVVADDVWDVEVLRELRRTGAWVLYTTRRATRFPETPLLWLDEVMEEEAKMVLRRAAELHDDARLPDAALELVGRCKCFVLDLALVGRWGEVRGRSDARPWQAILDRIVDIQRGAKGGEPLPWRAAVLRAGLGVLATDHPQNKELYLALAVLPKGLSFPSVVAGVLLYGDDYSTDDLLAAERVLGTLERLSIVALEDGGWYHVHEDHVDFVWGCLLTNQEARGTVVPRWQGYVSSVRALKTYPAVWLVEIWKVLEKVGEVAPAPYDAALDELSSSSGDLPKALKKAAEFHFCRKDWLDAYNKYKRLLQIKEDAAVDVDHSNILHNLGMCAYNAGQEQETENLLRRALTIQEKQRADGLHVARTLHALGICIRDSGLTEEAEGLLRRALATRKAKLSDDDLDVARTLHSLGVCTYNAGRAEEAEELLREALTTREKMLGKDHPEVAHTLFFVGRCAHTAGRADEAQSCFLRALSIYDEKLPRQNREMADTLYALGACDFEDGRVEEAEALFRRALAIREETLGERHLEVAYTLHAIGACSYSAGRREDAAEMFRRAHTLRGDEMQARRPGGVRGAFILWPSVAKAQSASVLALLAGGVLGALFLKASRPTCEL
ncbi:unnamed protein product [Scytosiphon promiscuus]